MSDMSFFRLGHNFPSLAILATSFLCLSCSKLSSGPYQYGDLNVEEYSERKYEGYYKVGDYSPLFSNGYTIPSDFTSIYQSGNIVYNMPSTGEVPLLVVPMDFKDKEGGKTGLGYIESAFNGDSSLNQYVSVAEYFDESSCGRLHLKPYVLQDYFRSTNYPKVSDLASITSDSGTTSALSTLYGECKTWITKAHPELDLDAYSFRTKNGKSILPIYFVYNAPYAGEYESSSSLNRSNMLWAFTVSRPAPISWSSIDMLHPSDGKVDAHTFIHETGHLFGLDDYYDPHSSEAISRLSPLGRMDMMDCSLGDHNAFSKMLLNWERPYVPTSDCSITIHQSSGNNECILLGKDWNKTMFGSYLLMELYTPTGLNYVDTYYRNDITMKLFETPGIKIYKVDSSLELYNGSYPTGTYLNESNYNGGRLAIGRSNSSSSAPLIQLLNKHQNNADLTPYYIASDHEGDERYLSGGSAVNIHLSEALFYEGDGIDEERFADLYEEIGVKIEVKTLNSSYATITFDFPS